MPFAPHEIENRKFVVALRGYQTDEVDAFLRAVAADYQALLETIDKRAATSEELLAEIERVVELTRESAEHEAAEVRRAVAEETAEVRGAAERDAAALRAAAQEEIEACYAEIARQAEQLQRVKAATRRRLNALEQTVDDAKQIVNHMQGGITPEPSLNGDSVAAVR